MPQHLKDLVVILVLATVVFAFARAPACAVASTPDDFKRRRNLWFAITLVAFLAHNFWIYIVVVAALLLLTMRREHNKLAMFFFIVLALPPIQGYITGLGVIQHFFVIDYYRLLSLTVLLPAFLYLRRQPDSEPFGRLLPDKLIAGYLILQFLLMTTVTTFTDTLRNGAFYASIDVFLPYYVASRAVRNLPAFRDALMAFAVAALIAGLIGAFEYARHWLVYNALDRALGVNWMYARYLERGDAVRAVVTSGQPIPFGFSMIVAAGLFAYLKKFVPSRLVWNLGMGLLLAGMIASMSRGPWVGAVAILLAFIVTGPAAAENFMKLAAFTLIAAVLLLVLPGGDAVIDRLPFIGNIDEANVTYRRRLFEISTGVIMQNPFFGAFDYFYSPAMQELRLNSAGFIDLVNTYLGIGLTSGLVGLSLFVGFFVVIFAGIVKSMRRLTDRHGEEYLLGRALFSTLVGIMITIYTVSSITIIPVIYWCVAGLGVAYARMLAHVRVAESSPQSSRSARLQPAVVAGR